MNTKVKEVCDIVGKMCILQAIVVYITVKFELRCVSVMMVVEECAAAAVCATLLSCF